MGTSQEDIKRWLNRGKEEGATHVIVVCDTFSYEDYPVMVKPEEKVKDIAKKYDGENMQRIMEVYNLSMDFDKQLAERRSFNY
ncbi:hypothetical protein [Dictyobacter kobayashii]|uniref:Uncharacterized protein n=1 Tax=Dictyobacter kobayashii TaxID=2014872 RepID=A0A402ACH8_9CHLR|nr:hypothetical protein [Dictyobacter kobayashii]GCE16807.1 hypothetical protein KDK_06070 [Dictyobacter kobayashii]